MAKTRFLTIGMEGRLQTNKGRSQVLFKRVTDQSWRQHYKLMFSLALIQMVTHRNIYSYVNMHRLLCTYSSSFHQIKKKSIIDDLPVAMSTLSTRSWFLIPFSQESGPLDKWPIIVLGQKIH